MTCGTTGASSDLVIVSFLEEAAYGVLQTGVSYNNVRLVSESFKQDTGTTTSDEITGNRRTTDIARTSVGATGELSTDLSYDGHSAFMNASIQSADWTAKISQTVTATFSTGPDIINRQSGSWISDGYTVNQWVRIKDAANATNNCYAKITTVAASDLTVKVFNDTNVFTAEGPTASVTVTQGAYSTDGSNCRAYTIQEEFTDLTNEFKQMLGMSINTWDLSIPEDGTITQAFSFLGKQQLMASSSAASDYNGTDSSGSGDVMNPVDNLDFFAENDAAKGIVSWGFSGNNNLRQRTQRGEIGPISVAAGTFELTGTLTAYFTNKTFFNKYLEFTDTSFAVGFTDLDTNGGGYVIDIPRCVPTDGTIAAGGVNTDIIADITWSAKEHETEGIMMRVVKFDSADVL